MIPEAALNLFINSHSQELLREMKPSIKKKLMTTMRHFINNLFAQVPFDNWITDWTCYILFYCVVFIYWHYERNQIDNFVILFVNATYIYNHYTQQPYSKQIMWYKVVQIVRWTRLIECRWLASCVILDLNVWMSLSCVILSLNLWILLLNVILNLIY